MHAFSPDSKLCAAVVASPNHGERRGAGAPDLLLLHYTGMPEAEEALRRLCAPDSGVSAHYLVFEDGRIVQCVPERRRAWHAGVSAWAGETDINSRSIGVEIANPGHDYGYPDFPDRQIEAVIALCADIAARHRIAPERILAHSDVAPARKQDPGEKFPWRALHAAGIGHWATAAPLAAGGASLRRGDAGESVRDLQERLRRYGYELQASGSYDAATESVVAAFQRHFRPQRVDGIADASTCATLDALLASLPKRL